MLTLQPSIRIFIHTAPADMRSIRPRNPMPPLTAAWGKVWGMRRGRGRA